MNQLEKVFFFCSAKKIDARSKIWTICINVKMFF